MKQAHNYCSIEQKEGIGMKKHALNGQISSLVKSLGVFFVCLNYTWKMCYISREFWET